MSSQAPDARLVETLSHHDNNTPMFSLAGRAQWVRVTDVHDSDTCKVVLDMGGGDFKRVVLRLAGIDTPEMATRDAYEKTLAYRARNRLLRWLLPHVCPENAHYYDKRDIIAMLFANPAIVFVRIQSFDKWGRCLATLHKTSDEGAPSVNDLLVSEGHAHVYDGGSKGKGWKGLGPVHKPEPAPNNQ
jgi:endonuclease YncB( thermonuclease family)